MPICLNAKSCYALGCFKFFLNYLVDDKKFYLVWLSSFKELEWKCKFPYQLPKKNPSFLI